MLKIVDGLELEVNFSTDFDFIIERFTFTAVASFLVPVVAASAALVASFEALVKISVRKAVQY